VPFYGLPFLIFFPSAINLYWMISSLLQLCLVLTARNPTFVKALGIKVRQNVSQPA
jgi:membrane protein insertase Oxa1/YidC/SpoIIIJ